MATIFRYVVSREAFSICSNWSWLPSSSGRGAASGTPPLSARAGTGLPTQALHSAHATATAAREQAAFARTRVIPATNHDSSPLARAACVPPTRHRALDRARAGGGHFAALEVPEVLVADVRSFFRSLPRSTMH